MKKINWTDKTLLFIGIIPLIWLVLVLITYFKVALEIEGFPKYNNPDSGQFKLFLSNYSIWNYGLLFLSQLGIIIVPALMISYRILSNYLLKLPRLTIRRVIYGYGGYLVLILFWLINPLADIIYWYLD